MDFEKKMKRLEEIVVKMEKGELPLEESLHLFEEGVKLSKECHQKLNEVECKVKQLTGFDENSQPILQNFQVHVE